MILFIGDTFMILAILQFIHNALTLLFGVYISAAFLGVVLKRNNILQLLGFSCTSGLVYLCAYLFLGENITREIYPLIVHIPLILFFIFRYRYRPMAAFISVLTAYLCCQISNWTGIAALTLTHNELYYYTTRIIVTICVFIFLLIRVADAMKRLLEISTEFLAILGIIPFVYYIFDYATNVYTSLLYSGSQVVVEFLGFTLCITCLLFIFLYFRKYEEQQETLHQNQLMELMRDQTKKELDNLHQAEQSVSILRHDMRHFLLTISSMIENDKNAEALSYIGEIINTSDQMAIRKYCKNELVNMVLSAQNEQLKKQDISLVHSIELPKNLPLSDVDLTAILSNGIENAMHAVASLPVEERIITINMHIHDEKLLISIKNPCTIMPEIKDGLPQSKEIGHGFGTRSIRYIVEKAGGNCQFASDGNCFVLRIIISTRTSSSQNLLQGL